MDAGMGLTWDETCERKDELWITAVYGVHAGALEEVGLRETGDGEKARALVAAEMKRVFLKLWKKRESLKPEATLEEWLREELLRGLSRRRARQEQWAQARRLARRGLRGIPVLSDILKILG